MLIKTYSTGILEVNTYLLIDEKSKEAIIIDLGGDFEKINAEINNNGATLKYIINTHGHFDHVMGQIDLQSKVNVPIMLHKEDEHHAKNITEYMQKWGFPAVTGSIEIDKYIDENSELSIGKHKIKIFHTPGHTRGGVCFLINNDLFSGDTLFMGTIGRTDLADGDYDTLINSIKTKLLPLNDEVKVYPGHGMTSTIGYERNNNEYLK